MTYPRSHSYQVAELGWVPRAEDCRVPEPAGRGCCTPSLPIEFIQAPWLLQQASWGKALHQESWALGLSPGPNASLLSDFAKSHALSLAFFFLMCKNEGLIFFWGVWIMEAAEHPMTAGITRVRYSRLQPPRYHSPTVWHPVGACPLWASVSLPQTQGR